MIPSPVVKDGLWSLIMAVSDPGWEGAAVGMLVSHERKLLGRWERAGLIKGSVPVVMSLMPSRMRAMGACGDLAAILTPRDLIHLGQDPLKLLEQCRTREDSPGLWSTWARCWTVTKAMDLHANTSGVGGDEEHVLSLRPDLFYPWPLIPILYQLTGQWRPLLAFSQITSTTMEHYADPKVVNRVFQQEWDFLLAHVLKPHTRTVLTTWPTWRWQIPGERWGFLE